MSRPRTCVSGKWLWFGMALVLLASLVSYLLVTGHPAPSGPNAIEFAVSDATHEGAARQFVVRQRYPGPVILMNWTFEQKASQGWKRIGGERFPGGKALDRDQGYRFSVTPPAEGSGYRVRVQYGTGLYGLQLWRERVRVACRRRRLAALVNYNEFEMGESVADLTR